MKTKCMMAAVLLLTSVSVLAADPDSNKASRERDAHAGDKIGNGGGAWVCREQNGDIRWVKLVDLFEAESEFGLTTAQFPGSYTEIVDQVQVRLFKTNRGFFEVLSPYLERVGYLKNNPVAIQYTEDTLELIDDSLYRVKPKVSKCTGGVLVRDPKSGEPMIPYEQVVNYKNDGNILVQSDLFNHLSTETEKAALVYHEAIYAYRRDTAQDVDSVLTRRIVGLIFSTLSTDEVAKQLASLVGATTTGPLGMKFVPLPRGTFQMGSPEGELGRYSNEPLHPVVIDHEFEIQSTDITQTQWVQMMGTNPSAHQGCDHCPVENVSFEDVQRFIEKLNQREREAKTGYFYSLPTEAEWEYAARAGTQTPYPFPAEQLGDYAWFDGNSGGTSHEVGTKKPIHWPSGDLYDMQGNVWQWVQDFYSDNYSSPTSGSARVLRGGTWDSVARDLRSAGRSFNGPSGRSSFVGARLVRTRLR